MIWREEDDIKNSVKKPEGRDPLGDKGMDGKIILKHIAQK
jgi:hypothetical protein